MKVYDCITYSNERLLFNLRLNILDKFVDRFIVIEANYTHSGNKKKINFNINLLFGTSNKAGANRNPKISIFFLLFKNSHNEINVLI